MSQDTSILLISSTDLTPTDIFEDSYTLNNNNIYDIVYKNKFNQYKSTIPISTSAISEENITKYSHLRNITYESTTGVIISINLQDPIYNADKLPLTIINGPSVTSFGFFI